jgi:hypothetical protein
MRLDDVWLQTTLNTPNISGVWQIRKCSLVSLKAHQPRQGQSPLAGCGGYVVACFRFMFSLEFAQSPDYDFFNIFYDLFLCSFGILLPMFQTNKQNFKKIKKKNLPVDSDLDVVGGFGRCVATNHSEHSKYLRCLANKKVFSC